MCSVMFPLEKVFISKKQTFRNVYVKKLEKIEFAEKF